MATSLQSGLEELEVIIQLGGMRRQAASRPKDRYALTLMEPALLGVGDIRILNQCYVTRKTVI
jgi:hypothetical protein